MGKKIAIIEFETPNSNEDALLEIFDQLPCMTDGNFKIRVMSVSNIIESKSSKDYELKSKDISQ